MVWLVRDACGIISAIFALILLGYAQYTLLTIVLLPQSNSFEKYVHIVLFEFLSFMTLASHIMTIFTDPGSVPQKILSCEQPEPISYNQDAQQYINKSQEESFSQQQQHFSDQHNQLPLATMTSSIIVQQQQLMNLPNVYKCTECCTFKPDRAHHCSVCKRCIRKMDHHCPWVNNCVGERNQKYFALFTLYAALTSSHALYLTVKHLLHCLDNDWNTPDVSCPIMVQGRPTPGRLIMLVLLVFLALLYSLFSFMMFFMQLRAIWTDWTGIEQLKREDRERSSGCKSLTKVCGKCCCLWFWPCTKPPPKSSPQLDQFIAQQQQRVEAFATHQMDCSV